MVSTQRKEELIAAFKKDAPWGEYVRFLDTINSVSELDELVPFMKEAACNGGIEPLRDNTISFYRKNLERWPDPKLEDWFQKEFPLVSARLDTPQKIRVFLRAVHSRKEVDGYDGVSVSTLASVFEDIIRKHYIEGQEAVRYSRSRGNAWSDALRILYHTQLPYWTVSYMLLPEHTCCGGSTSGFVVDWRTKEERKTAGDW